MKKPVHTIVIAVLSLGLLALFLRGAHLSEVWSEIKEADPWLIGISTVTTVLTMAVRALRWQYLLAPIGRTRFRPAFRTTMIGFAASSVLPARPGEVIRPYLLARQEGLSVSATFATIVVERLLDSVTVVMLLAAFVLFFDPGMALADGTMYRLIRIGGLAVGGGTLALLGMLIFAAGHPEALGRWVIRLEHLLPGRIAHTLAGLLQSFAEGLAVVRAPMRLMIALALSLVLWLTIVLGIWTAVLAFHIALPFTGSFLLLALMAVGVSVPTPGGVGAFEAAVQIGLTSFYRVPNDRAVGAALVLHAVSILPTVVLGFLFLVQDGLGLGDMGKLAHVAAEGDVK
jgi:glycosyltransferase 2 family protein